MIKKTEHPCPISAKDKTKAMKPRTTNHTVDSLSRRRNICTCIYEVLSNAKQSPRDLKAAMGLANSEFNNNDMHDCEEALRFLLATVMDQFGDSAQSISSANGITDAAAAWTFFRSQNTAEIFGKCVGVLKSTHTCGKPTCSGARTVWETFFILQLPSHRGGTLENLIELLKRPEVMSGNDRWQCCECQHNASSMVSRKFAFVPQVLFVQLNRLDFNLDAEEYVHRLVTYPVVLSITSSDATMANFFLLGAVW